MIASLALNLTPGPDMLYVAARSAGEGRSAGIVSALGITVGTLFHVAALALGLSALLSTVPAAYVVLRMGGAAYLIYLGVRALARTNAIRPVDMQSASLSAVFRQGVVTNVLNPKVVIFFLAFLPQFVDPVRGNPVGQIIVLGLLFNTSGTLVNVGVAIAASRAATRLRTTGHTGLLLQRVTALIFIGLGLRLAFVGSQ
jgi:threonine/homoserine/homoserine lactone efflux protein